MQNAHSISLNALRVFLIVAQHGSLKQAAVDLNVTPGAISHQVRHLETQLGVKLFVRGNNSIHLTDAGRNLVQHAAPGYQIINAALKDTSRSSHELRVHASMSFAMRWLIPRLNEFKAQNPKVQVKLETVYEMGLNANPDADVTITYCKSNDLPKDAIVLFADACRPYLCPSLVPENFDLGALDKIPALQCAAENWDWQLWLQRSNLADTRLNYAESFDLDDAAIRAAVGGMGMVLTSANMIEDELRHNHLCPLPSSQAVELGYYIIQNSTRETGLGQRFITWLTHTGLQPRI